METIFYKYQGTGNDFIVMDNRSGSFPKGDHEHIAHMCHRRFGVGADGLILLEEDTETDFKMVYFNADGHEGSMCGNGGRCIVAFAKDLGIIDGQTTFNAVDGLHEATLEKGTVLLKMQDVGSLKNKGKALFLDTGSPHHVQLVHGLEKLDVQKEGAKLRYGLYGKTGCNINFVEQKGQALFNVRTYERGVEAETLSCGTGVTAVALGMHHLKRTKSTEIEIGTKGGNLKVTFEPKNDGYGNIFLSGPAKKVFKGSL